MKIGLLTLLISVASTAAAGELKRIQSLDELQWRHRVVIVNTTGDQEKPIDALRADQAEIDDRDIIWFVIKDTRITSNFDGKLSPSFERKLLNGYSPGNTGVFLVGKDGGVKQSLDELNLETIYQTIDAMPMRQSEMREKSPNPAPPSP